MGGIIVGTSKQRSNQPITFKIDCVDEQTTKSEQVDAILTSKKCRKQQKQIAKYKETIIKCNQYINNNQCDRAIHTLKQIIDKNQNLEGFQFEGVGNQESWHGYFKQGAMGWYKNFQKEGKNILNIFDLLSLCFSLKVKNLDSDLINIKEQCQWYQKILQNEERYQLYFGLGNLFYNNKNYVKAEYYYKKSLQLNNNFAKTYEYLAWIYGYWFDYDSLALQYAKKSMELNNISITCEYIFAICTQRTIDKKILLEQIIKKDQNYYRVYVNLGQLQKDKEKAQNRYQKCLSFDDQYKIAYLKLGDIQRFAQNFSEAYDLYMKVKQIDEMEDYAYFYLGCLSEDQGEYEEALTLYQLCLEINPFNPDICSTIANYYKNLGETSKAIIYMKRQLSQNPYDYQSANLLGIYYDQQQEADNAIVYFQKALEINSQYYEANLNLGSSFQQKKEYQKGIRYFMKAHQLDPNQVDPYFGLAICEGESGNIDLAIEWCYDCILKGADQDKEVFEYLGDIFKKKKDYQRSLHTYLIHSIQRQTINTDYILSNLIRQIERAQAINIIEKELQVPKQSQFFYAQLGKIALQLQLPDITIICFNKIKEISYSCSLNCNVEEELKRYKGNSFYIRNNYNFGIRSYFDKLKLINTKKMFQQQFINLYGL